MIVFKKPRYAYMAFLLLTINLVQAATVTIPHDFVANSPAVAAQVNANFNAVKTSVDDNDSNIATLMAAVAQLQADLASVTSNLTAVTSDLATANATITAIGTNTVLELDGYLILSTINGYDTAEFTNINVQINDGSGNTGGAVNGLGNLTIGYNEADASATEFCSDPQHDNSTDCTTNSGIWDNNVRRGSHNLILGSANSYDDFGGIVAGTSNIINNSYANVLGGRLNQATGFSSSVSGGRENQATAFYSSVSGGIVNQATGDYSSVSGGRLNQATGFFSSVSGGIGNQATGDYSSVSGGENNQAIGEWSSVSGGENNQAIGEWSSVSGGENNQAIGQSSSVSGGSNNSATAWRSSVSGGNTRTATGTNDWRAGSLFEDN